jgi:hypothetical protein
MLSRPIITVTEKVDVMVRYEPKDGAADIDGTRSNDFDSGNHGYFTLMQSKTLLLSRQARRSQKCRQSAFVLSGPANLMVSPELASARAV